MIGRNRAECSRFRMLDPEFRVMRSKLEKAVDSGKLPVLQKGGDFIAASAERLPQAVEMAARKSAWPVLILEGPTPINAARVPASVLVLPLERTVGQTDKTEDQRVEAALGAILAKSDEQESIAGGMTKWRALGLSCRKAGEGDVESSVRLFECLLTGDMSLQSLESHWFWRLAKRASEESGYEFDALTGRLLTDFTIWFSPYTGETLGLDEALLVYETVQSNWQSNMRPSHCFGAQYWNHPSINATFSGVGGEVAFHETQDEAITAALESNGQILSWAGRTDAAFETACKEKDIPLLRIEDGFLRSVGLGAGLARGAMLAVDDLGIYYDPSRASRLEVLLKEYELTDFEEERAIALTDLIKTARVSKYNFGKTRSYDFPGDREKILVPGQVADDAAIRKSRSATIDCATTPNVNLDLLKQVRERNPEAYLIFKPHPDVETGLRKGRLTRDEVLHFADDIAEDANVIDLIEAVGTVETFSSLSGFEALLRNKKVIVHGAPFYAGWGLSEDLTRIEGRHRNRSLPELVYLALVQYARTIDPVTLLPCRPEFLVSRLTSQRSDKRHLLTTAIKRHASWIGRKLGI